MFGTLFFAKVELSQLALMKAVLKQKRILFTISNRCNSLY